MGKGGNATKTPVTFTAPLEPRNDFYWGDKDEPHAKRRTEILKKYPEIKKLYGHDPMFKYVVGLLFMIQMTTAYLVRNASWPVFFVAAYVIGGTSNHMLMLAMHELAHNLGFKKIFHNKLFSIVANLPIAVPSAISFKRYHMDHHRYQGEDGIDTDVPTFLEGKIVNNTITKLLFVIFQIFFYAVRPMLVCPKKPGNWEVVNAISCLSFDAFIAYTMGISALGYLLLGSFLGAGLHPVAGHFIAEHYVFVKGAETYSYYGILNFFAFNVGYHNEHHDFPFIPGSRLPMVRQIASEYYNNLPAHDSWVKVIWNYITDPNISAFSRVKRTSLSKDERSKLKFN